MRSYVISAKSPSSRKILLLEVSLADLYLKEKSHKIRALIKPNSTELLLPHCVKQKSPRDRQKHDNNAYDQICVGLSLQIIGTVLGCVVVVYLHPIYLGIYV